MSLCSDCQQPIGACSWEREFKPVPGWTAEETTVCMWGKHGKRKRKTVTSYEVTACPLYQPPKNKAVKPGGLPRPIIAVNVCTGEETCLQSIRAGRDLGLEPHKIKQVLNGEAKTSRGYTFRYEEEEDE